MEKFSEKVAGVFASIIGIIFFLLMMGFGMIANFLYLAGGALIVYGIWWMVS